MKDEKYTLDVVHQIWNDNTGERLEIGPDRDGLDLIEIRSYDDMSKVTQMITLTRGQLEQLHAAIGKQLS